MGRTFQSVLSGMTDVGVHVPHCDRHAWRLLALVHRLAASMLLYVSVRKGLLSHFIFRFTPSSPPSSPLPPSSLPPPSLPPRPPSYTGMPMILSYTANHYENAFANGQTCAGVNTPFNSSERAFAAKNTNALSVRRSQLKVR